MERLLERAVARRAEARGWDTARRRGALGLLASGVGIGANALLCALKLVAGAASGSVSITADALNNLSDASSSVITLLGFKLAGKPADAEHPYGHGRYEYLSALLIAALILFIGAQTMLSGVRRALSPAAVAFGAAETGVLVFSIAAKAVLSRFNKRMGEKIGSGALAASADDSRNDALATSAVLLAAIAARATGWQRLDGVMGAAVAGFILVSGVKLLQETLRPVLGGAPPAGEIEAIREKVLSYPGVLGAHDLLVHDYGPGRQFATIHVEMSAGEDPMKSHAVIDRIERDMLAERGVRLVVHYDPVATDDPRVPLLREFLEKEAAGIDARLTLHDVRLEPDEDGGARVLFDCAAPYDLPLPEEEIERRLTAALRARYPRLSLVMTLDRGVFAQK